MSDKTLARRTAVSVSFDGVNITNAISNYITSLTYMDCEEGESDDLQIELQDRDGKWLDKWISSAITKSSKNKKVGKMKSSALVISAVITAKNWEDDGKDYKLKCGKFSLDTVKASGPPSTVTIKAIGLSYSTPMRQTKKSKTWENIKLSAIAKQIASANGINCKFLSTKDPTYKKVEQSKTSDLAFLSKLCKDADISLKTTSNGLVLFLKSQYESKKVVATIKKSSQDVLKYTLNNTDGETQYTSCRVRHPTKKGTISGIAYIDDYDKDGKSNKQLELYAKVHSAAEAKSLAAAQLRLHNQHECTASFTMLGNVKLIAGVTVRVSGWGYWDGKYMISKAKHSVSNGGYTTQIECRKIIDKTL